MLSEKLQKILDSVPETDTRKSQLVALVAALNSAGLEIAPFTTGSNYLNDKGNYPGGLVDHIACVWGQLNLLDKAYNTAIPPASLAIAAIGHVAYRVSDGYGHPYYVAKPLLKSGKASKNPWEHNDKYVEISPSTVNILTVWKQIPNLTIEESQAITMATEELADGIKLYPLTIYLRTAYLFGIWYFEKHHESEG